MMPTFMTLTTTPDTAQIVALVVWLLLAAYIVVDGYLTHGRKRLWLTMATSIAFAVTGIYLIRTYVTPEHLPEVFAVPLRSWGLMVVIGMCLCFLVQLHFGKRAGLNSENILSIWIYGGLAAALGARLLHVAVNFSDYASEPMRIFTLWDGGMAFIGGALSALVLTAVYLVRKKKPLAALDALVLGVALTHGIGRIGCFLAGCCYGRETTLPWGVSFPPGSIAQAIMTQSGLIAADQATPHLHPTQIYEAVACVAIGLFLLWMIRRPKPTPGIVAASYLALYPSVRFVIEMVRNDPERQFAFRFPAEDPVILSTTQAVSLVLVPLALLAIYKLRSGWKLPFKQPELSSMAGADSQARPQ